MVMKGMKLNRNEEKIIVIVIAVLLISVIIYRFAVFKSDSVTVIKNEDKNEEVQNSESKEAGDIYVYVSGAVKNPDVYKLKSGARVVDALEAAGGFMDNADKTSVNLAEKLVDEQCINIREKNETKEMVTENKSSIAAGKININTATAKELADFLPGIGETIAGNIVNYREKYGRFKSISEITRVDRIGDKTYERIKDMITVN